MAIYGLEEFREFPASDLEHGQLSLVVKRRWVEDFERDVADAASARSRLIHQLPTIAGVQVTDWGATDDSRAHEIVEVLLEVIPAALSAAAAIISAWFASDLHRRPVRRAPTSTSASSSPPVTDAIPHDGVAAVRITKPDGSSLELLSDTALPTDGLLDMIDRFLRES
jgi:hypothetical protein